MKTKTIKPFAFKAADHRYLGEEPRWEVQPTEKNRLSQFARAFTWYNYYFTKKEAKEMLLQWLEHHERLKELKVIKGVSDDEYPLTYCWLSRMQLMGLVLTEEENTKFEEVLKDLLTKNQVIKPTDAELEAESEQKKVTIQDRLKEKIKDCADELDNLFETFIKDGAKMSAQYKPINVIRGMNVAPQLISYISDIWKKDLAMFEAVIAGDDKELAESYDKYSKIQLRNIVKFAEQVIADCNSYVQVKKTERKPRAKKAVSPEKLVLKFKYLKECAELKIKSESPTKLIAAQEAWLYDCKKRKLIHVVADLNAGSITVKGSSIVGFDEVQTVQKTLRKPAEQIKQVIGGGKPAARKAFKEIKSTDIKWNGRSSENLVILKAW